jgi:hypothetical protein
MAAQAVSALVQVGEPTPPTQFGYSAAQASAAGLTITNGVTPDFWIYCVFVIILLVSCVWMLISPPMAMAEPGATFAGGQYPGPYPGGPVTPYAGGSSPAVADPAWRVPDLPQQTGQQASQLSGQQADEQTSREAEPETEPDADPEAAQTTELDSTRDGRIG